MGKSDIKDKFRSIIPVSWKDLGITLGILICASVLCMLLKTLSENDFHVPLVFLLAVLLISFFTEGYLFGLASALVAVFLVNYVFTFPYLELNFSLTGYPLTFICMLVTSIISCTMATKLKQSESIKVQAERESMRANLLRTVSHDFRTPLTSVIGNIDIILEDDGCLGKEETKELLSDAKREVEWLINMVENLLSVTRIGDDPKTNIHKELQAVEELVACATERFKKKYGEFRVHISIPEEVIFVNADAMLIEQVINNILINTVLHAKGATEAYLKVEKEGSSVIFKHEDNGKGFSKEELAHAFDDYVLRNGKETSASARGMGIGLSVCNTIIKAHNGSMSISNREQGGARVVFTLPLCEVNNETEI